MQIFEKQKTVSSTQDRVCRPIGLLCGESQLPDIIRSRESASAGPIAHVSLRHPEVLDTGQCLMGKKGCRLDILISSVVLLLLLEGEGA